MVSINNNAAAQTAPASATAGHTSILDAEDRVEAVKNALADIDKRIADYKSAFKAYDQMLVKKIYYALETDKRAKDLRRPAGKSVTRTSAASKKN